jgi:hypothetical protein
MSTLKMLGLASLAALALTAFFGASSAQAMDTQLCKVHTSLTCPAGSEIKTVHAILTAGGPYGGVAKILNSTVDILCLTFLYEGEVLGLGNPQLIHTTNLTLAGCGTSSSHNNCTVTAEELPLFDLLKTGLDEGVLTSLNGKKRIKCTILGFVKINCVYDQTGLEYEATGGAAGGMITAEESPASLEEGEGLCPAASSLDFLLQLLEETHILS